MSKQIIYRHPVLKGQPRAKGLTKFSISIWSST